MNKEYFTENLSVETLVKFTDKMLNFEKASKSRNIKSKLSKIIPAVAAFILMIGLANFIGIIDTGDILDRLEGVYSGAVTVDKNTNLITTEVNEDEYIIIERQRFKKTSTSIIIILDSTTFTDREEITVDIEPLKHMANLQHLTISAIGSQLSDISPLAELKNLTYFKLLGGQVSDISPLAGLTNLTNLTLWCNQLSDISPLAGLTNLTNLTLCCNQLSDISPLAELKNLTNLNLTGVQLDDFGVLAKLPNLEYLTLRYNIVFKDIRGLEESKNLKGLYLSNDFSLTPEMQEALRKALPNTDITIIG